jgi:hypothetical protein
MTTIYRIAEQIQRQFYGGNVPDDAELRIPEIKLLVNQAANNRLALKRQELIAMDDNTIPACMIATYRSVPVQEEGGELYAELPAQPIAAPLNMGVWSVTDSRNPANDIIPMLSGVMNILSKDITAQIKSYWQEGNRLYLSSSVKASRIASVTIKLLVNDLSKYGDYDPYPVPADMELEIIGDVLNILRARDERQDNLNDSVEQKV